jgi:hypothetical protein
VIAAPRVAAAPRVIAALRVAGAAPVVNVTDRDEVAGAALAGSCCPIAKLSTTPTASPTRAFRLPVLGPGLLPATLRIQPRPSDRAEIARHFEIYTEGLDMEHTNLRAVCPRVPQLSFRHTKTDRHTPLPETRTGLVNGETDESKGAAGARTSTYVARLVV